MTIKIDKKYSCSANDKLSINQESNYALMSSTSPKQRNIEFMQVPV